MRCSVIEPHSPAPQICRQLPRAPKQHGVQPRLARSFHVLRPIIKKKISLGLYASTRTASRYIFRSGLLLRLVAQHVYRKKPVHPEAAAGNMLPMGFTSVGEDPQRIPGRHQMRHDGDHRDVHLEYLAVGQMKCLVVGTGRRGTTKLFVNVATGDRSRFVSRLQLAGKYQVPDLPAGRLTSLPTW